MVLWGTDMRRHITVTVPRGGLESRGSSLIAHSPGVNDRGGRTSSSNSGSSSRRRRRSATESRVAEGERETRAPAAAGDEAATHLGRAHAPAHRFVATSNLHRATREEEAAAACIQRWWRSHNGRLLFLRLRDALHLAEKCLTYDLLRRVSPKEAELLRDPSMQCRVRLRLAGDQFPPRVVFKIFSRPGATSSTYMSGCRLIQPASQAATDAYHMMGTRSFCKQITLDAQLHERARVTGEVDVTTGKDYMQYVSYLDETEARLGGRGNRWRTLSLAELPRGDKGRQVAAAAPSPTLAPVGDRRYHRDARPSGRLSSAPPEVPRHPTLDASSSSSSSSRRRWRSRQALLRLARLRRDYGLVPPPSARADDGADAGMGDRDREATVLPSLSDERPGRADATADERRPRATAAECGRWAEEAWEEEAELLFAWARDLSLESLDFSADQELG
uniref:Uncharacterized protein n=1 Tax=Petromyzon marinus TaxID=7757 RepID=A0AAJ7U2M2_PETMA|nr:putative uncharacterized protein CXorf58 homolog [Petromyzon marinus]XP_032828579.1 putative uncharacterized protein CXorf58 homolog [Petromyzon marinus]XP_032828580.1 putative uncharacterized protein CXorf58 homolog [Petromyzon marinus]